MTPTPMAQARSLLLMFTTLWMVIPAQAREEIEVKIGAAHFPPYTVRPEKGADTGLLPQLVDALNAAQQHYRFVLVPTSIPRRFGDFKQGRTDMAIFENPQWDWQEIPHVAVDMGLEDAEVYVTQHLPERDESYFSDLTGKRLALYSGYHYAFADFKSDPKYLVEHFTATLTYSHDSNLLMVERGRADVALVTRSYLSDFQARNPQSAQALRTSERVDQVYHHYALLRPGAPISGEAFAGLLQQLRDQGELLRIFQPYQIIISQPRAD
ncbi:substrate-binding periplasmic protein [Pseudomonas sp. JUb96]|uniref:substrate-binding periplasmic protein n=1 Tax=Pseudomonas sp. JUb96 TaxID=2940539 RepID=UPI0022272110|nr:transporter substrate-binding domain-containing protein [Pseudomonas sp. JUb96]